MPATRDLDAIRGAAQECRGCALYRNATQTVFGEGAVGALVMLIGEQPGDHEDRAGRPFVGPAGRVLDAALDEAGIDRSAVYVTNAVKHFKWAPRGKRRLHQTPLAGEIAACRPWLDAEIEIVNPRVAVALGATAAKALLGPSFRVTKQRGELVALPPRLALATVHPSSILRIEEAAERAAAEHQLAADLALVAAALSDGD